MRRARRQGHPDPPGAGAGLPRPALVRAPRVRPVLGAGRRGRHRRRHARLRQRLPALHQRVGGRPRRRVPAVQAAARGFAALHRSATAAPIIDTSPRSSATACCTRFPTLQDRCRSRTAAAGCARSLERLRAGVRRSTRSCSRRTRSRCSSATSASTRSTRRTRRASSTSSGVDHVLFGSDYPHPEGMADPLSYVDELEGSPRRQAKIMGGNLGRLMNVGVPA